MKKILISCVILYTFTACNNNGDASGNDNSGNNAYTTPVINYAVVRYLPHDTTAYTEGLLFHNGLLFESTGLADTLPGAKSVIGMVDTATGKINTRIVLNRYENPGQKMGYFGEGIVFINDKLYQLTYKNKTGFVYDAKTFKRTGQFGFPSEEGWGLTTDGTHLIMSDGTSNITYIDPSTFKVISVLHVTDNQEPVTLLNELEYVKGYIYANIYTTSDIVKIDPRSAQVVGRIDGASLDREVKSMYPGAMEMNGIAFNAATGTFYVTGKMWPRMYEISFPH